MKRRAARSLLWPFVPFYRLGLALRERRFRPGAPSIRRLQWPVISIGNLSTGGSGKTPLTIALARALAARGVHVDVLSRGYGRQPSKLPLLVRPHGTSEDFGDEPLEIARAAQAPVFVAKERYQAGVLAERADAHGIHLLDDGFQHRQLARDIDILLLSRADFSDHLLPAGNLRETLDAAARASVIAIPADEPELEAEIRSRGWQAEIWRLRRRMDVPRVDGPVAAFCGIARPLQFFEGLARAGVRVAARFTFPDHHRYTPADLARIDAESRNAGATALLTTAKDQVRLGSLRVSLPIHAVPLRIEIQDEKAAMDWLMSRVSLHA